MSPHEKDVADPPSSGISIHNGVPNVSSVVVENHPTILPVGHIPPTVEFGIVLFPLIILLKYTEKAPHVYSPGGGLLGTACVVLEPTRISAMMERVIDREVFMEYVLVYIIET